MKLSYDPKYNVAYIRFHEKLGQVTTIKISDDMNIDIARTGPYMVWSHEPRATTHAPRLYNHDSIPRKN